MANVSVRLMVALFCAVIIATPALLLSLLSQASDAAAADVIPPFYVVTMRQLSTAFADRMARLADDTLAAQHYARDASCGAYRSSGAPIAAVDFCALAAANTSAALHYGDAASPMPTNMVLLRRVRRVAPYSALPFWDTWSSLNATFVTPSRTATRRVSRTSTLSRSRGRRGRVMSATLAVASEETSPWGTSVLPLCLKQMTSTTWPSSSRATGSKKARMVPPMNVARVLTNRWGTPFDVMSPNAECIDAAAQSSTTPTLSMAWFPLGSAVPTVALVTIPTYHDPVATSNATLYLWGTRTVPKRSGRNATRTRSVPAVTPPPGRRRRSRTHTEVTASVTLTRRNAWPNIMVRTGNVAVAATQDDALGVHAFIDAAEGGTAEVNGVATSMLPAARAATVLMWRDALRVRPTTAFAARNGTLLQAAANAVFADAAALDVARRTSVWPSAQGYVILGNATSSRDAGNRLTLEQLGIREGLWNPRLEAVLSLAYSSADLAAAPGARFVLRQLQDSLNEEAAQWAQASPADWTTMPRVMHALRSDLGSVLRDPAEECRFSAAAQSLSCIADVYLLAPRCEVALTRFTEPSALDCYVEVRRVTLLIATADPENSITTSLFSGSRAVSVIVGVTTAAGAIVCILALLHFVFHPLKVIGSILRALADINLSELDRMDASFIRELYEMQLAVDKLMRRMHQYGRYMPDKSQLNAVLDGEIDLQAFEDTKVALAPMKSAKAVGAVPHSVTVVAEYRSRRRPTESRKINDMRKMATFALVFSSGDDVHEMLLSQVRVRFGERIGEPLELRDKGPPRRSRIPTAQTMLLTNTDDVMQAIERCRDNTLHLVVLKASQKRFYPWAMLLISVAATVTCARLCTLWLADSQLYVNRAGGFGAFAITAKLGGNILCCGYLLRRFVLSSNDFALWVPVALQETVFSILCGAFTVSALLILSSHTRLTRVLKFNAPRSSNHERLILKYAILGYIVGDVAPLMALSYVAASNPEVYLDGTTIAACALLSLSIFSFVLQKALPSCVAHLQRRADETAAQDGSNSSVGHAASKALAGTMLTVIHRSGIIDDQRHNAMLAGKYDDFELGGLPVNKPAADAGDPKRSQGHVSNARLALGEREATVLRIGVRQAESHFAAMNTVEIQLFCERFLGYAFAEIRSYGGMIMSVRGTEITACFNCHRVLLRHTAAAFRAFVAVQQCVASNQPTWSEDDLECPQVYGAVVAGRDLLIGYTGRSESRSLQHLGYSALLLDCLHSIGELSGAQLVVSQNLCDLVEDWIAEEARARVAASAFGMSNNNSFAFSTTATVGTTDAEGGRAGTLRSSKTKTASPAAPLVPTGVRELDVLRISVPGLSALRKQVGSWEANVVPDDHSEADGASSSGASGDNGNRADPSASPSKHADQWARFEPVFEICFGMSEEQLLSSRSAFSLLHATPNPTGVRQHLAKFPLDVPLHCVSVWAAKHKALRLVSGLGPQLYEAELHASERNNRQFGFAGSGADAGQGLVSDDDDEDEETVRKKAQSAKAPANRAVLGPDHQHPVISKVLASDKYTVYFTDI